MPVEHFIEIVQMRADAESIHSALVECLREKGMPLNEIIGMAWDLMELQLFLAAGLECRRD